jgi:hypothetical protein
MSSENPFRITSSSACVELRCPHCERNLYIAAPEALVSLTTCPHVNCQHVALVCSGEALGRDQLGWEIGDGSIAMTLERFLKPRVRSLDATDALFVFVHFMIFVVAPITMLAYAWREGLELLALMVISTSPAALVGLGMMTAVLLCVLDVRRDLRRITAVRRHSFARARWLVAKVR